MTIQRRSFQAPALVPPRAAAVAPAGTAAAAAPAATPQGAHQAHHGHRPHGAGGNGRHRAGWHGPGSRPKRAGKPQRKARRRGASGVPSEDDEHDVHSQAGEQAGTAAVQLREQAQDGGDDQDEGGGERSRQDRQARARGLSGKADDAGGGLRRHRLFDSKVPLQRCVKGSIGLVAQAAQRQDVAHTAAALRRLQLDLLRAARAGGRVDRGGLKRVAEHLLAHFAKPQRPEGGFAPAVVMLHLTLPMLLLQLQVPRTEEQAALAIAKLMVQARRSER